MSKYIKCPKCRSKNILIIEDNRNNFYEGAKGYFITESLLGALAFSNSKKSVFKCANCGKKFKKIW